MQPSAERRSVAGIVGLALLATAGTLTMVSAGAGVLAGTPSSLDLALGAPPAAWGHGPLVVRGPSASTSPRSGGASAGSARGHSLRHQDVVPVTPVSVPPVSLPPVVLPPVTVPPVTVPPVVGPPVVTPPTTPVGVPAYRPGTLPGVPSVQPGSDDEQTPAVKEHGTSKQHGTAKEHGSAKQHGTAKAHRQHKKDRGERYRSQD